MTVRQESIETSALSERNSTWGQKRIAGSASLRSRLCFPEEIKQKVQVPQLLIMSKEKEPSYAGVSLLVEVRLPILIKVKVIPMSATVRSRKSVHTTAAFGDAK